MKDNSSYDDIHQYESDESYEYEYEKNNNLIKYDDNDYFNMIDNEYDNYMMDEHFKFLNDIIYLDAPLLYIINNMEINVIHGGIKVNIIDYLPILKKGYTIPESLRNIIYIYEFLHVKNPQNDILYKKAFDDNVPENYLDYYKHNGRYDNISIDELLLEIDLINKIFNVYIDFELDNDNNIKLESFEYQLNTINGYEWVNYILFSPLKLYMAIILGDELIVEDFLNDVDPRNDNNEAYHLAINKDNKDIIELVKNKIIQLNWLDKQVLIKEFNKYDFYHEDIIQYYQSKKY